MKTLYLDPKAWDLALDSAGGIAAATDGYSLAQDVASAIRVFLGEAYYDTALGVPYSAEVLGRLPPLPLLKAQMTAQGMLVPGVGDIAINFNTIDRSRKLTGRVQVTSSAGVTSAATF